MPLAVSPAQECSEAHLVLATSDGAVCGTAQGGRAGIKPSLLFEMSKAAGRSARADG